jgi:outer membrane protein assembly factor BamB
VFNKNKLSPIWIFSQKGNIWRMHFADNDILTGETRDPETKRVYFFSLDIKSGRTFLKDFVFENEEYWVASENAGGRFLFLHRFVQPEIPMHKGIIAIDAKTGDKIWENSELEYIFHNSDGVYAIKQLFESTEISLLNFDTGELIKKFLPGENDNVYALREKCTEEYFNADFRYSENLTHEIISRETKDKNISGGIESIIYNDKIIFNYYRINGNLLDNTLCIYNINSGEKLYEEILNKNASYCVPDSFFMKGEYLFCLKDKNQIVTFRL